MRPQKMAREVTVEQSLAPLKRKGKSPRATPVSLTSEMNNVMISYGLTPPAPTMPSLSVPPPTAVVASKSRTPMTGAVPRPSSKWARSSDVECEGGGGDDEDGSLAIWLICPDGGAELADVG